MSFLQENWAAIIVALLAVSEVLALIPKVKANSVFQLVVGLLKGLMPKKKDELPKA